MATFYDTYDGLYAPALTSKPSSETGVSKEALPVEDSFLDNSPMVGLEGVCSHPYKGIQNLRNLVGKQADMLMASRSNQQYLVFRGVTKDNLAQIDNARHKVGKFCRMSHDINADLLVIKLMPSPMHEAAHITLADRVRSSLIPMGLSISSLYPVGSGRCHGRSRSKEGDSGYRPLVRTREADWPTLVFEAGLSESLPRLRYDAQWWLSNSKGDVKVAVIISIKQAERTLQVEKWCLVPVARRVTRAYPNPNNQAGTKMEEIIITLDSTAQPGASIQPSTIQSQYSVTGAPLVLGFQDLFLRPPIPPETDIILSATDLSLWADYFWRNLT